MRLRLLVWGSAVMGALTVGWSLWNFPLADWRLLVFLAIIHALFSRFFTFPLSPGRHLNTGFVLALAGVFALPPAGAVLAALPGMLMALWQRKLGFAVWVTYIGSVCVGLLAGGLIWQTWGTDGHLTFGLVPVAIAPLIMYHGVNLGCVAGRVALSSGQPYWHSLGTYLRDIGMGGLALSLFAVPMGMALRTVGPTLEVAFYLAGLAGAAELTRVYVGRQELLRQARVDGLTGALNRAAWENHVGKLTAQGVPAGLLVVLDVNRLKAVNDRHGHAMGDEVLQDLVRSMQQVLRRGDAIYRYGGDEFVTFLIDVNTGSNVLTRIGAVLTDFRERWAAHGVDVGVSMGYAEAPADGRQFPQLFELADQRMYSVKRAQAGD